MNPARRMLMSDSPAAARAGIGSDNRHPAKTELLDDITPNRSPACGPGHYRSSRGGEIQRGAGNPQRMIH